MPTPIVLPILIVPTPYCGHAVARRVQHSQVAKALNLTRACASPTLARSISASNESAVQLAHKFGSESHEVLRTLGGQFAASLIRVHRKFKQFVALPQILVCD